MDLSSIYTNPSAHRPCDRARAYLLELIAAAATGQRRLAPLKQLAQQAATSVTTMHKAAARLASEGYLQVSPRRGILVKEHRLPQMVTSDEPGRRNWEKVHDTLLRDIENGIYSPSRLLDTQSALSRRYNTSVHTIRRVVRHLVDEKIVIRKASRFAVPARAHQRSGSTILVVLRGYPEGRLMPISPRTLFQYRILEETVKKNGLTLKVLGCNYVGTDFLGAKDLARLLSVPAPWLLGVIVFTAAMESSFLEQIAAILTQQKLPVAVIEEELRSSPFKTMNRSSHIRYFELANMPRDGAAMGQQLWQLGHRHAAAIVTESTFDFATVRLNGLRQVFGSRPDSSLEVLLIADGHVQEKARSGEPVQIATMRTSPDFNDPEVSWREEARLRHELLFAADKTNSLVNNLTRKVVFARLAELLNHVKMSVWVAPNDYFARECCDFLRINGHGVPEELSVVGYDDSDIAIAEQIASFNFNFTSYCAAAIEHLLQSPQTSHRRVSHGSGFDGFLVERSTVGPPRT